MAFRTDIQALRGLAVLLVVFHHAKLGLPAAGHLGVDIFFVISGFLITGIVKRGIEQGNFSFTEFYFRRAKRLLPAAYIAFLVTSVFSIAILDTQELRDFAKQVFGAVTFTGNIVLWRQADYFDGPAALKPLLHVWSLSIEEQYYLLLPAILVYVPRRFWLVGAFVVLIASLALCILFMPSKPIAAFYLLPTRAWELAIGSVAAMLVPGVVNKLKPALTLLFWPSVAALLVIPTMPIASTHPVPDAYIVCFSTVIVILRRHKSLNSRSGPRLLAKIGEFSYSLYLVHWPIFAFMNNLYVEVPPTGVRLGALALALFLGFLLYRFIELPIRRSEIQYSRRLLSATIGASLALASIPFGMTLAHAPVIDYAEIRRVNHGFGAACEFVQDFTPKVECRNSDRPSLLVWGDSFAMHLVPGIVATTSAGVVQATRSVCGPFIGLAPMDNTTYTRSWAKSCIAFNQSVFDYLVVTPSIKVVVLSSPYTQFLEAQKGESARAWRSLKTIDGQFVESEPSMDGAIEALQRTQAKLKLLGKRAVIVAPPPTSGVDIGRCLKRKTTGRLILGANTDCNIPIDEYKEKQVLVLNFLRRVQNELDIPVIYFDEILCSGSTCATTLDGTFVYRDDAHFTYAGSKMVAQKLGLGELLQAVAK